MGRGEKNKKKEKFLKGHSANQDQPKPTKNLPLLSHRLKLK